LKLAEGGGVEPLTGSLPPLSSNQIIPMDGTF